MYQMQDNLIDQDDMLSHQTYNTDILSHCGIGGIQPPIYVCNSLTCFVSVLHSRINYLHYSKCGGVQTGMGCPDIASNFVTRVLRSFFFA